MGHISVVLTSGIELILISMWRILDSYLIIICTNIPSTLKIISAPNNRTVIKKDITLSRGN